jgi:hypothetical protein
MLSRPSRRERSAPFGSPGCAVSPAQAQSALDKIDFSSFADFGGHLMDWGIKCILARVFCPVTLLGYIWHLCRLSAEHGGTRTAFAYDLALRQKACEAVPIRQSRRPCSHAQAARLLEQGVPDVSYVFATIDFDVLREAKLKLDSRAKQTVASRRAWYLAWLACPVVARRPGSEPLRPQSAAGRPTPWAARRSAPASGSQRHRSRSRGRAGSTTDLADGREGGKACGRKGAAPTSSAGSKGKVRASWGAMLCRAT